MCALDASSSHNLQTPSLVRRPGLGSCLCAWEQWGLGKLAGLAMHQRLISKPWLAGPVSQGAYEDEEVMHGKHCDAWLRHLHFSATDAGSGASTWAPGSPFLCPPASCLPARPGGPASPTALLSRLSVFINVSSRRLT